MTPTEIAEIRALIAKIEKVEDKISLLMDGVYKSLCDIYMEVHLARARIEELIPYQPPKKATPSSIPKQMEIEPL